MNSAVKRALVLISVLLLFVSAMVLYSCVNGGGLSEGAIPGMNTFKARRMAGAVPNDNELLAITTNTEDGIEIAEELLLLINIYNTAQCDILSFRINNNLYSYESGDFILSPNKTAIEANYRPDSVESGEFKIKISHLRYRKDGITRTISELANNTITIRIKPIFKFSVVIPAENTLFEEDYITPQATVEFMKPIALHLHEDSQMNFSQGIYINGELVPVCKPNYSFRGWFTEKGGNGRRVTRNDSFDFYSDITVYAHHEPFFSYVPYESKYSIGEDGEPLKGVAIKSLEPAGKENVTPINLQSEIHGMPVLAVLKGSMNGLSTLEINLPSGIEIIEESVFEGMNVRVALAGLFNLKVIEAKAFKNSTGQNRTSAYALAPNLEYIGTEAFFGCSWHSTTNVGNNGDGRLIIPASVKEIGFSAFKNSGFKEVYFDNEISLEAMGAEAFAGSENLELVRFSAIIPFNYTAPSSTYVEAPTRIGGVQEISNNAFRGCFNLRVINLSEGITRIGNNAFHADSTHNFAITSLVLPSTLEHIGNQAFYNLRSLTSISFRTDSSAGEQKLNHIGDYSFGFTSTEYVRFRFLGEAHYGKSPFFGNSEIRAIEFDTEIAPTFDGAGFQLTELNYLKILVPNALAVQRFRDSFKVGSISLNIYDKFKQQFVDNSNTLRFGYEEMDAGEVRLTYVVKNYLGSHPNSVEKNINISSLTAVWVGGVQFTVRAIGRYFASENIESISLPATVEIIDDNAFTKCIMLKSVNFTSLINLKSIGSHAFSETALESFTSSNSLEEIKNNAFFRCYELKNVSIIRGRAVVVVGGSIDGNETLGISVGIEAFAYSGIENLRLGKNVRVLASGAFAYCTAISEIFIDRITPPVQPNNASLRPFQSCKADDKSLIIYVSNEHANSVALFETADRWNTYSYQAREINFVYN
ncbi:MAG: leucine-rich repeat protein [Firmicutes bacterium]|nr:leucine-rich repeat protein [Bacillota bacterium]